MSTLLTEGMLLPQEIAQLTLGERCGEGATSHVYRSSHQGRELAVKCAKPGFEEILLREARGLSLAAGSSVVGLRGVGSHPEGGAVVLALELLRGSFISELVPAERTPQQRLDLALRVFECAGTALLQLHAMGWAHGDVKPENLCLREGKESEVVLIDFGMVTQEQVVSGGTPRYLPPEVPP